MARKILKGNISGREKAAILLISLGPEYSAQIFKHLNDEEIEELTLEIANMRKISSEEEDKVLNEFYEICLAQEYISEGGISYAKEVLERALGAQKAMDIINKLTASLQV
ncbi:MAG: flagellar motor switch protein FliG, partial [Candidatus Alkaliphilus sp. MAG34]